MKIMGKHLFTSLLKSLPECSVEIKLNPNMHHGLQGPVLAQFLITSFTSSIHMGLLVP